MVLPDPHLTSARALRGLSPTRRLDTALESRSVCCCPTSEHEFERERIPYTPSTWKPKNSSTAYNFARVLSALISKRNDVATALSLFDQTRLLTCKFTYAYVRALEYKKLRVRLLVHWRKEETSREFPATIDELEKLYTLHTCGLLRCYK